MSLCGYPSYSSDILVRALHQKHVCMEDGQRERKREREERQRAMERKRDSESKNEREREIERGTEKR